MPKFFETFQDAGGGNWVGKEEKDAMIADGTAFTVTRVARGASKYGERYVIDTEIDGEMRSIGFPADTVQSRDRLLDALIEYLKGENPEPVSLKMQRIGRSIILSDPDAEE